MLSEGKPSPVFGNPAEQRAHPTPPALTEFMHQIWHPEHIWEQQNMFSSLPSLTGGGYWKRLSTSGVSCTPTELSCPSVGDCKRAVPLPRGGYWEKLSTHIGLPGIISTMAASPDFRDLGLSSSFLPERRSIFSFSSANLQAMCAVWQSMTGE